MLWYSRLAHTCSHFFFLNTINCITASGCSRDQIWTQILNVPLFYWVIDALAWFWRGFLVVISIILHTSKCHFTPFKVPSHDINLIIFLMIKLHLVPQILTWHLLNVLNLHNAENRLARKVHVYYLGEWRWNQEIELASSFHRLLIRAQLQHLKRRKKKPRRFYTHQPTRRPPVSCNTCWSYATHRVTWGDHKKRLTELENTPPPTTTANVWQAKPCCAYVIQTHINILTTE